MNIYFELVRFSTVVVFVIFFAKDFAKAEFKPMAIGNVAIEYLSNKHTNFKNDSIDQTTLASSNGFSMIREMGSVVGFDFGFTYFQNKNVSVEWLDVPNTPVEFYGFFLNAGLKVSLPISRVIPWVGTGYSVGKLVFSNVNDREVSDYTLMIYSKGNKGATSQYYKGGLDIALSSSSGIRLSYSQMNPYTPSSSELGGQPYDMKIETYGIGIFAFTDVLGGK